MSDLAGDSGVGPGSGGRSGAGGQVNQVSGTMLRKIDADLAGPAVALSASDAARQARSGAKGQRNRSSCS